MKSGVKMKVRLISYSQPPEGELYVGENIQELIAYCARVSNPSNQGNTETSERLLTYLAKEKHWSPFEMVSACLEIETTRDIARQILRHRSFSFQEFSQRYADPEQELELTLQQDPRLQDTKNRQNSLDIDDPDLKLDWLKHQAEVTLKVREALDWARENNIAKEVRRVVLPEGLTTSRMYMNGSLRSWMHYIELRSGNGTQKEHREVALACAEELRKIFPIIDKFIEKT